MWKIEIYIQGRLLYKAVEKALLRYSYLLDARRKLDSPRDFPTVSRF